MMKMRKRLNEASSVKISVNDIVLKASALASVKVPATNSSWMDSHIRQYKNVNMSVAIQTDHGLMAPNIKAVNLKGLEQISQEVKDLAGRARENKLSLDELNDGTFTVSNLGMFGITSFASIVNQPHGAIMSVGAGEERAVVRNGQIVARHMMTVTLTCDHRVVDGAVGARFLAAFKRLCEEPAAMLL